MSPFNEKADKSLLKSGSFGETSFIEKAFQHLRESLQHEEVF